MARQHTSGQGGGQALRRPGSVRGEMLTSDMLANAFREFDGDEKGEADVAPPWHPPLALALALALTSTLASTLALALALALARAPALTLRHRPYPRPHPRPHRVH